MGRWLRDRKGREVRLAPDFDLVENVLHADGVPLLRLESPENMDPMIFQAISRAQRELAGAEAEA